MLDIVLKICIQSLLVEVILDRATLQETVSVNDVPLTLEQ